MYPIKAKQKINCCSNQIILVVKNKHPLNMLQQIEAWEVFKRIWKKWNVETWELTHLETITWASHVSDPAGLLFLSIRSTSFVCRWIFPAHTFCLLIILEVGFICYNAGPGQIFCITCSIQSPLPSDLSFCASYFR